MTYLHCACHTSRRRAVIDNINHCYYVCIKDISCFDPKTYHEPVLAPALSEHLLTCLVICGQILSPL